MRHSQASAALVPKHADTLGEQLTSPREVPPTVVQVREAVLKHRRVFQVLHADLAELQHQAALIVGRRTVGIARVFMAAGQLLERRDGLVRVLPVQLALHVSGAMQAFLGAFIVTLRPVDAADLQE